MVGATVSTLMGVMDPLLGKLSTLLEKEYGKLKGLQPGIASLRDELRSMKAALEDLSELEDPSSLVKEWMSQLRELSYDIEDCINDFMHRLGQDDAHDGVISKITGWLKTMQLYHHTAGQIAKLKEHAMEVNDRRKRLKLDVAPYSSSAMAIDPRLSALFEEADRIIGIDGPRDELVNRLIGEIDLAHQRRVVSIVGSGGLGKTTLASQIYKKIKSQFDCAIFVSVSRSPDVIKILTDVLLQILEPSKTVSDDDSQRNKRIKEDLNLKSIEYHQLINIIREELQTKRYFVLIDDIWSKQAWKDIQCAFPNNNRSSRIMTTTRIQHVAKHCSFPHEDYVYTMKHLDSHDSKRLFLKRIFGREDDCSLELKEVADDILKKCDGLPLAIVNTASLLAVKPTTKQEWERVRNSLCSALGQDHEMEVVKRILFLSYYDLPHHLKICLLDLSIFPEDHKIYPKRIIWRWIAEGLITGQQGQNLEEAGQMYFNELINRNMIQLVQTDYRGRALTCRVHDIMLDLLISLSTEENFVTILNRQTLTSSSNKFRRLSLQGNCEEHHVWLGTGNFSHVRSLSVFGDCKQLPPLTGLQSLRVFDAVDCNHMEEDSVCIEDIGSLHQLRYLSLGSFSKVPRQIGKLQLLQTIELRGTKTVQELPATIVQLHQLVRLSVKPGVKFPAGISNMRALQELECFLCSIDSVNVVLELGNLINLKELTIHWGCDGVTGDERYKEALMSSLCKLGESNLQTLIITSSVVYSANFLIDSWCPPPCHLQHFEMPGWLNFHRIPGRISSFYALMCLNIIVEQVQQEDLQLLQDLPVLVILGIVQPSKQRVRESNQETFTISRRRFQCLKTFCFCKVGAALIFEEGAMPKLETLQFEFSAHDEVSNFGFYHLCSLKHISVQMICRGARAWEVEAAEAALRNLANLNLNQPALGIRRFYEAEMAKDEEQKEKTNVAEEEHAAELQAGTSIL